MKTNLTAKDFRRVALGLMDAAEGAHMGHPDFRVGGRIFASLHPDLRSGMVKLTPDQQIEFARAHPTVFMPENGAWGRQGCTAVRLDSVDEETLGEALTLAHQNIARATTARKPKARAKKPTRSRR